MKLIVTLTIDIPDPQEWTDAYGAEGSANIRQDVKDLRPQPGTGSGCVG